MPIKTESDGLFTRTRRGVDCTTETGAAEIHEWMRQMKAARPWETTFDDVLDAFEADAEVYAALEPAQVKDKRLRQLIQQDAGEVKGLVQFVRALREQGSTDAAFMQTVKLARAHQQMTLRFAAPLVKHGEPVNKARRASVAVRRMRIEAKREKIIAAVEGGMKQKDAAQRFCVSTGTVSNIMTAHRKKTLKAGVHRRKR